MPQPSETEIKLTLVEFQALIPELTKELEMQLAEEAEMDAFTDDSQDGSDLWETPVVDSKSVVKLSPIVERITGKKIKTEWIKEGGYESAAEAITHLVEQMELDYSRDESKSNE